MTSLSTQRPRHRRVLASVVFALALLAAACGGDPVPISVPTSSGESASQAGGQAAAAAVSAAQSQLGAILVNDAGFSLYGFTDDVDGQSTCDGGCANAWPPVLVPSATLPSELDAAVFSVIQRADGTNQLKAGKWPLYLFAGDTAPGQTTGHLSGDVWFVANPTGGLIDASAPAPDADEAAPAAVDVDAGDDDGYGSATAQPEPADEPTQAAPATAVPATAVPATPVPATPVPAQPTPTPDPYSSDY